MNILYQIPIISNICIAIISFKNNFLSTFKSTKNRKIRITKGKIYMYLTDIITKFFYCSNHFIN